jgi:hypothetical protein
MSLRDKKRGENALPAMNCRDENPPDVPVPQGRLKTAFQLSLRDKKRGENALPAMNCRAIFKCPYGTEINPFLMNPYSYIKSV